MIKVEALEDEIAVAHERRYMAIRGYKQFNKEYRRVLKGEHDRRLGSDNPASRLHLLASIADVEVPLYVSNHSMLPIRRVVAEPGQDGPHGGDDTIEVTRKKGLMIPRDEVCVCLDCIAKEIDQRVTPTYRRRHHVRGGDWCAIHGTVLHRVTAGDPFSERPDYWRDAGMIEPLETCFAQLPDRGWFSRYTEISMALLARKRPASTYHLQSALSDRATSLGLRKAAQGSKPLVSDLFLDSVPRVWADRHVPGFHMKRKGIFFPRMDMMVRHYRLVWPGDSYAMVLATLFENSREALDLLEKADSPVEVPAAGVVRRMGEHFWHGGVWKTYIACRGNIKEVATRLGLSREHVGSVMSSLGLPGLQKKGMHRRWNALVRFGEGSSLEQACVAEGVSPDEFQAILRQCAARVVTAARLAGFGPSGESCVDKAA